MAKNAIDNAGEIIEAFGGIRPMAKKIDVAVTTVQGWKKRDVIPAARRSLILKAADEHDIDLDGLIGKSANDAAKVKKPTSVVRDESVKGSDNVAKPVSKDSDKNDSVPPKDDAVVEEAIIIPAPEDKKKPKAVVSESEKKILNHKTTETFDQPSVSSGLTFVLVVALLMALGFGAIAAYFWQKSNAEQAAEAARLEQVRIQELERKLSEAEEQADDQGFFGKLIPKDLNQQIANLQEKTQAIQKDIAQTSQIVQEQAKAISDDVLADDAGTINQRLTKLEVHLQDIAGRPVLAGMLARVDNMQSDPNGEDVLARTVKELDAMLGALQIEETADNVAGGADYAINATLDQAREQSAAIGQTFEAVPTQDLKAAAMLLAMAQLRTALNRDNEAFESDLSLLRKVVGDDNPELMRALDRLAPQAQSGVLTPSGLSTELRSFAGDAVAASLSGEDVSVKERAKARMNELFEVQKDGELISGTETQAALVKAEQQLQNGDIEAAINSVQGIDGNAAAALAPWLEKAQASLNAQNAKAVVSDVLDVVGKGTYIHDEKSGIKMYVPKKSNITY